MKKFISSVCAVLLLVSLSGCSLSDVIADAVIGAMEAETRLSDEEWNAMVAEDAPLRREDSLKKKQNGGKKDETKEFPQNELTAGLPVPEYTQITRSMNLMGNCMIYIEWTYENAKAYADALRGVGFTENASETDESGMYMFSASCADGRTVMLTFYGAESMIMITNAAASDD